MACPARVILATRVGRSVGVPPTEVGLEDEDEDEDEAEEAAEDKKE